MCYFFIASTSNLSPMFQISNQHSEDTKPTVTSYPELKAASALPFPISVKEVRTS